MGKLLDENTTKAPFINSQTENLNLTHSTHWKLQILIEVSKPFDDNDFS